MKRALIITSLCAAFGIAAYGTDATAMSANEKQALIGIKKKGQYSDWKELFSHVKLDPGHKIERYYNGEIKGKLYSGWAYAKHPQGHCTRQYFSWVQHYEGDGYSQDLNLYSTGKQEKIGCNGITVDEVERRRRHKKFAGTYRLLSLTEAEAKTKVQSHIDKTTPGYKALHVFPITKTMGVDEVHPENDEAYEVKLLGRQWARVIVKNLKNNNCYDVQFELIRNVRTRDNSFYEGGYSIDMGSGDGNLIPTSDYKVDESVDYEYGIGKYYEDKPVTKENMFHKGTRRACRVIPGEPHE